MKIILHEDRTKMYFQALLLLWKLTTHRKMAFSVFVMEYTISSNCTYYSCFKTCINMITVTFIFLKAKVASFIGFEDLNDFNDLFWNFFDFYDSFHYGFIELMIEFNMLYFGLFTLEYLVNKFNSKYTSMASVMMKNIVHHLNQKWLFGPRSNLYFYP